MAPSSNHILRISSDGNAKASESHKSIEKYGIRYQNPLNGLQRDISLLRSARFSAVSRHGLDLTKKIRNTTDEKAI